MKKQLMEALVFWGLSICLIFSANTIKNEPDTANSAESIDDLVVETDSIVSRDEFYTPKYLELDQNTEIWENPEWFERQNIEETKGEQLYVRVTHYCPCLKCCGKSDGITATGVLATAGRTISVDPKIIPYGSVVIIDGHAYVAEDTGVRGAAIDIYCDNHSEALQRGMYYTEVEVIS